MIRIVKEREREREREEFRFHGAHSTATATGCGLFSAASTEFFFPVSSVTGFYRVSVHGAVRISCASSFSRLPWNKSHSIRESVTFSFVLLLFQSSISASVCVCTTRGSPSAKGVAGVSRRCRRSLWRL